MSIDKWPEIIQQAAQSQLGILALVVLVISSIAIVFFRSASELVRLFVFLCLLISVGLLGAAILQQVNPVQINDDCDLPFEERPLDCPLR